MKINLIIIGLAALVCASCMTHSTEMNKVHLGMSEADVIRILGEPKAKAEVKGGGKTFYYSLAEMGVGNMPYSVKFVDGKVDSYGRDSGASSPQTVPIITPMPIVR
jgi:outer membrane protein assembly factor BamE (lipoprotein component of BamABCDE complex)